MQVLLLGGLIWMTAILAAARLARRLLLPWRGRAAAPALLAMLALAGLLMFRPHEDIFGGEDPGAYINSGISYGRQGKFFYVDDLLALVAPDLRPLFYFGHAGYGPTKDACLWVCNEHQALIGPHFQPAYPLLIAAATRLLGTPHAALYIVPLFAILTALALGVLASRLLQPRRWAGLAVFWLFLLNPLTVWHGRAPRPEVIAAFMLFGGLAILTMEALAPRRQSGGIWLGGVCLLLAPFFHVTAWYVVAPALALAVILLGAGRREFLPVLLIAALALCALDYQARRITDYYGLGHMLRLVLGNPWGWLAAAAVPAGLLVIGRAVRRRFAPGNRDRWRRAAAWLLGAAGVIIPVYYYFRRDGQGSLPFLGRPVEHFLYLTDFEALVNMLSLPAAGAALAGWLVWCLWPPGAPGRSSNARLALAALSLPGILLAGRLNDFMMTRYLMVVVVPMLALVLAALAAAGGACLCRGRRRRGWPAGGWRRRRPLAVMLLAGFFAALGIWGRGHLITLTEYKGLAHFLGQFAGIVRAADGALLVEYSRLAAPFDHYFNLPVLGIDNERRESYARIEDEWERLMRLFPDVPVFFCSPFHAPVSDRFVFTPVLDGAWEYRRLRQAGRRLPSKVRRNVMELSLYRMRLAAKAPPGCRDWRSPYMVQFDAGNMGLRRFANLRSGAWSIPGARWQDLRLSLQDRRPASDLLLLALGCPDLSAADLAIQPLGEDWRAIRLPAAALGKITGDRAGDFGLIAAGMVLDARGQAFDLVQNLPAPALVRRDLPPMQARWARARAAMLLPRPPTASGRLLLLLRAPPAGAHLELRGPARSLVACSLPPMEWRWVTAPYARQLSEPEWEWVELQVAPAWNPATPGFPDDLGVLVGIAAVLP